MDRFICPPDHRHGVVGTCYVFHKCRCDNCRTGNTDRSRARSRQHLYGTYDNGLTDAGPVREHLAHLQSFGLGWKRIAALSGVGNTAVQSLIYGRKGGPDDPRKGEVIKRTPRAKAAAILAVKPELTALAPSACIPSRGVHRRVQALVARGWSQSKLCAMVGRERGNWWTMMQADQVTVSFHLEVSKLYDRIWNTEPPHADWPDKTARTRALNYSKQRRWLPPLAWDDIDTDVTPPISDGANGIDEMAVDLALQGEDVRLSPAERREAVTRLHSHRWSDPRIAQQLHIANRTVLRIRQELNLEAFEDGDLVKRDAA
ncbi:helix-turn-helix domain-containing protein [Cryobacterium psychrophilum]|uniref:Uncharacterized protein n=1 Tax=Cryobacterium psychrophilum TaxID=41988 RepID=A0A4Y8KSA7_9MICO|nr:helix-turn-helix domain-containing protein [Cryobacterium psychrophilum]TDW30991.1 Homeodomain-like domain-containing protein [Cryobacterium psychrophilum]TFD80853.1 hypothetical protein E3T53_04310 [Cryobacterium psychrophilum]